MSPYNKARAILVMACLAGVCGGPADAASPAPQPAMPRYQHIFVLIEENQSFDKMMQHPQWTPNLHRLAAEYGLASQFYAEVHSSEGNYVAMVGGDTFGIHDDDAFFCKQGTKDKYCENSTTAHYADHDIAAPSLADQLTEAGLTWKAYLEDLPAPGSLVPRWPSKDYPVPGMPNELYAAKHNGFVSFHSVNHEPYPELAEHFVNFRQLDEDLAQDRMPSYAHIVPNQCNDMHGMGAKNGPNVPADCVGSPDPSGLIQRGDTQVGRLVGKIMASKLWRDPGNNAIVITFDENDGADRMQGVQGCCGYEPGSRANFGGGRIPTIVITNYGPRHVEDATPYNHYSLLRTTEAAFGIETYLGHAADSDKGVMTMTPLFATGDSQ
jgi:phospholipase C